MLFLEEMGRAAEVAAVRATEAREDHAVVADRGRKDLQAVPDDRVVVRHLLRGFAEQAPQETHALLAAEIVPIGCELLIRKDRPVTAEDDLRARRVAPDELDEALHLVERGQDERDADVLIAFFQLADELAFVRVLKDDRRGIEVVRDVFEREMDLMGTGAEHPLRAGHLAVQELIADRGAIAVPGAERPADACQEQPAR